MSRSIVDIPSSGRLPGRDRPVAMARAEWTKLFARRRTYLGLLALLLVNLGFLALFRLPGARGLFVAMVTQAGYDFDTHFTALTVAAALLQLSSAPCAIYLAMLGGELMAKETDDGTIRMILSRPVSRWSVVRSKWLALLMAVELLTAFYLLANLGLGFLAAGRWGPMLLIETGSYRMVPLDFDATEGLLRYLAAGAVMGLTTPAFAGLAFMFSCFRIKPAAAIAAPLLIFMADFTLRSIPLFAPYQQAFLTYHWTAWKRLFDPFIPWASIGQSLLVLIALNVSCLLVGGAAFCTSDVKNSGG